MVSKEGAEIGKTWVARIREIWQRQRVPRANPAVLVSHLFAAYLPKSVVVVLPR